MAVSMIYRPLATPKHLFPLVAIAWLLFSIYLSRVNIKSHSKYIPTLIVVAIALIGFSNFQTEIIEENNKWTSTQNILSHTEDVESGDIIITDVESLRYDERGVLPYYYPGSIPYYTENMTIPILEEGKCYWIFSNNSIPESVEKQLTDQGYHSEFRANGSFAKAYYVYAYSVTNIC